MPSTALAHREHEHSCRDLEETGRLHRRSCDEQARCAIRVSGRTRPHTVLALGDGDTNTLNVAATLLSNIGVESSAHLQTCRRTGVLCNTDRILTTITVCLITAGAVTLVAAAGI